ncbi:single-stranded DNA-binding protein [Devriesea agamarum]|uniref:single-stranded DNA-binding protein n=1 Tax=Devriesea agamarum TaxID=472569 RepID=UPI00071DBFBE|nr:single-stranded DNA-binding protein [Devriesea agamarum]
MGIIRRAEGIQGNLTKKGIATGQTAKGMDWANFDLAVTRRARNEQGQWHDAGTDFYHVACYGALARHAVASLHGGDPVVVSGELSEQSRMVADAAGQPAIQTRQVIKADLVAPDLHMVDVQLNRSPAVENSPSESLQAREKMAADWSDVTVRQPGSAGPTAGM